MLNFARRAGKFAVYYMQNPRQLLFPQRDLVLRAAYGARFLCSHENYIEREILLRGSFEPESTAATQRYVNDGSVTIDVGANVGYYSLLLSHCAGPTGQVHAFEPTRWAYERCLRNLELNRARRGAPISVNRTGLLARERAGYEAIESQFSARTLAYQTVEELRFTTLDAYCKAQGITRIDFMKVDVDGYDAQVVEGAYETLANSHATLLCELHDAALRARGDSLAKYVELLRCLGYEHGTVLDGPIQGVVPLRDLVARPAIGSVNLLLTRASSQVILDNARFPRVARNT